MSSTDQVPNDSKRTPRRRGGADRTPGDHEQREAEHREREQREAEHRKADEADEDLKRTALERWDDEGGSR